MTDLVEDAIDTCRICSGPAEPNQPLFHPCRCSGTIRYIHQDCLTTWLQHSKKKSCDVCKSEYAFEKVYDQHMPERLPTLLFARRLAVQLFQWQMFGIRAIFVSSVWLALLPYLTVQVWRLYFWGGRAVAWSTYDEPRPRNASSSPSKPSTNTTLAVLFGYRLTILGKEVNFGEVISDVSSDIFTGQIISALIIILFLAVFLLREWIVQNARPGVFGDPLALDGVPAEAAEGATNEILPVPPAIPEPPPVVPRDILPPPAPDSPTHSNPLPFPLIESKPSSPGGGESDLETRSYGDNSSVFAVSRTPSPPIDVDVNREYIRRQREHYFALPSTTPSKTLVSPSFPVHSQTPGAGPSTMPVEPAAKSSASSASASETDPLMIALPPSPPSSDGGYASAYLNRRGKLRVQQTQPSWRKRSESSDFSDSASEQDDLASWISNNPSFAFNVPPGWKLSTSTTDSQSEPDRTSLAPGRVTSSARSDTSRSTSLSWDVVRPPSSFAAESIASPIGDPTNPSANGDFEAGEGTTLTVPQQLRPLPNGMQMKLPAKDPVYLRKQAEGGGAASPPTTSLHTPRRPPLPPTTPNDELPPPSPRPSHARPSPLPRTIDSVPSPLQNIASASTPADIGVGATYRAPEDLAVASSSSSSYFPSSEVGPKRVHNESADGLEVEQQQGDAAADPPRVRLEGEQLVPPNGPARAEVPALPGAEPQDDAPIDDMADDPGDQGDAPEGGEDDLDGLLEAVGMRGPFISLVQNVSLMVFILSVTIALAVFLPYTLGKALALNLMKPKRLLFLLHMPIKAVRLITDPLVDVVLWFIRPASSHLYLILKEVWKLKTSGTAKSRISLTQLYHRAIWRLRQFAPSFQKSSHLPTSSNIVCSFMQSAYNAIARYLPRSLFASDSKHKPTTNSEIFSAIRTFAVSFARFWRRTAIDDGPREQIFAIWLGYVAIICSALLFLRSGVMLNGATRVIRKVVAQQLIVIKVALFILIELMLFPFGCGVILDLSTLPLFPDTSLWNRLEYCANAPVAAAFFHWMLGTMFMYQFAMVLSLARGHMRKGALWFVKDPQDPTFHPIRDILDRPTLGQLRKLGISAIMYAVVIAGGIGVAVYSLSFVWTPYRQLLPLRWNSRHPLSELPIDLLFLHILLPIILESIKPRELISPFCHAWWEHAAHEFRLTSFLFGDRVMEEEVGSRFTWRRLPLIRDLAWIRRDEVEPPDDGGFARVPASDSVAFPENLKQMLISTNEAGAPLDDRGAELIQAQNDAARRAHRDPAEDYQIVYLPPNFARRVIAFMFYLWATGSAITVVALGTPILLGRRILDQVPGMPVHDGYSFLVGGTAAWAIAVIFGWFSRRYKEIQEQRAINLTLMAKATSWEQAKLRADLYLGGALRTIIWAFNHIITWAMLGFMIPLLMATVLQLYVILPIRVGMYPNSEGSIPTLHIWEDWTLGCVLAAIMVRIGRMQPRSPLLRAWDAVIRNEPEDIDVRRAFNDLIGPLAGGLLVLIVIPALIPFLILRGFHFQLPEGISICMVYPSLFITASVIQTAGRLSRLAMKWAQSVRDAEYLVDMRLQNMDDPTTGAAQPVVQGQGVDEADDVPPLEVIG